MQQKLTHTAAYDPEVGQLKCKLYTDSFNHDATGGQDTGNQRAHTLWIQPHCIAQLIDRVKDKQSQFSFSTLQANSILHVADCTSCLQTTRHKISLQTFKS